jgi:hypothetical protein
MLQLNEQQAQRLQKIQLERDTRRVADHTAQCFPEIAARAGDRFAAFVGHAVDRGAAHGLTHALCVARYLACWCALGAEFEAKPGFEWAAAILSDRRRPQGAKVFQLCRRAAESLARQSPQPGSTAGSAAGPSKAADFDRAIAALDAALVDAGDLGSLLPGWRLRLGQPCDIDTLDLRPTASDIGLPYRFEAGRWLRAPAAPAGAAYTLSILSTPGAALAPNAAGAVSEGAPRLPVRFSLLSRPPGQPPQGLRLRTRAAACCDPAVHPWVRLNGPQGLTDWRGTQARDVTLALPARTPVVPDGDPLQPIVAAEGGASISLLSLASCGLQEEGPAMGDLQTEIAVYAADQYLMAWRREPLGPLEWPEPPGGRPPQTTLPRCRIERDGSSVDATPWQAGLQDLDRQLVRGLSRLFTAWQRESGVVDARLHAEPAVLAGEAGLAWGWSSRPEGMLAPPFMRLAGHLDLVACQLNLRLTGQFTLQGAVSRLSLQSHGQETLRADWQRQPGAALLPDGSPALASFRHPFVLHMDSIAQPEPAMLDHGPAMGALVGSCGLRPRADGSGLQWFARLVIEPASVILHWSEPQLGVRQVPLALLPELDLLDWSLG